MNNEEDESSCPWINLGQSHGASWSIKLHDDHHDLFLLQCMIKDCTLIMNAVIKKTGKTLAMYELYIKL